MGDKLKNGELSWDKLSGDKLSRDKLSRDKLSGDKLSGGKLPLSHLRKLFSSFQNACSPLRRVMDRLSPDVPDRNEVKPWKS
jgi:hypothetical protein